MCIRQHDSRTRRVQRRNKRGKDLLLDVAVKKKHGEIYLDRESCGVILQLLVLLHSSQTLMTLAPLISPFQLLL